MLNTNLEIWKHLSKDHCCSAKIRNRNVRSRNGNIIPKIKIIHWNVGGRLWSNKTVDIEALCLQEKPNLCFISEANLWANVDIEDSQIPGYSLILPNTMITLGHARIVLLVRNDTKVTKIEEYMDEVTASIWVRIGHGRHNSLVIGGLYREHSQLGQQELASTWLERKSLQEQRWNLLVNKWKLAANNPRCILIGDINLDYFKWAVPDQMNESMVRQVQEEIETLGFIQMITGHTRRWRAQADSLIDQVWSNCHQRTVRHFNFERGDSDHNVIGLVVSTKDINNLWQ